MRGSTSALLGLAVAATMGMSAHGAYLETFDSAPIGSINNVSGWYGGTGTPPSVNTGGVAGSQGVGRATEGFNWTAHTFRWDTMAIGDKVIMGMDYQSDGSNGFNDDRMGWTTNGGSVSSSTHFGAQLDDAGGTQGVKTYWKDSHGTQQWEILNFANAGMAITSNGWYRARATFTKIGDTAAQIDVTVQALDPEGNPVGSIYTGSMADSSQPTGVYAAPAALFAGDLTPMFKNFNASATGNVDNAYFSGVIAVPEPAALSVLALGSLMLGRRRHA